MENRTPIWYLAKAGATKIKMASYKKHSVTKLDQFQPMVHCLFCVNAILSNGPWWPSWIVNFHKYEIVPFRDHCDHI